MNLIDPHHGALVLVDFQQRLMPAIHHGAEAVAQMLRDGGFDDVQVLPVLGGLMAIHVAR